LDGRFGNDPKGSARSDSQPPVPRHRPRVNQRDSHTPTLRGSDLEITVNVPFLQPGAFLVQNPITIPEVKAERFLGRLTTEQLALVEAGVRNWLGL
jgi:hypothetical protein